MEALVWSDKFSVGVAALDEQHKQVIDLINKLIALHSTELNVDEIRSIFSDLVKYGLDHLQFEEKLLQEHDYPDYVKHKHEHFLYIKKATKQMKNVTNIDEQTLFETTEFLLDWWTHHILEEDMKYRSFLEERGIK